MLSSGVLSLEALLSSPQHPAALMRPFVCRPVPGVQQFLTNDCLPSPTLATTGAGSDVFLCLQGPARGPTTPHTLLSGSLLEFQISFPSDEQSLGRAQQRGVGCQAV